MLWLSGVLWNLTRWMSMFVCGYFVNQETGSPLLVQLVGASVWAPMFVGGVMSGVISDRFDRRRTILSQYALFAPLAVLIAALMFGGGIEVWMVYPYILLIGIGGVLDITTRRALIVDVVGEARITRALAYESLGGVAGNLTGTLLGGALIAFWGYGPVFVVVACCYVVAFAALSQVRLARPARGGQGNASMMLQDLREGFHYARQNGALISIFGITVIYNVFYFSFTPLIPAFADRLEVDALLTGVLAGAIPLGSITGNVLFTRSVPFGRGLIYSGGTVVALVSLLVFAASPWYATALLALFFAGVGNACFATMQSVLVMATAEPRMRGRAMGLLSMAIGTGPFAMLLLGTAAQATDPQVAVLANAAMGLCALALWTKTRPEAHRLP